MLQTKQKGQGLVEFALVLPLLMLLLLGIIEAARIIWAYTTVQTAAREAARYAVTGKPYITSNFTYCIDPAGEPGASAPWNCNEDQYVADRVQAIKLIASRRITSSLTYNEACATSLDVLNNGPCTQKGGNYGIAIVGQVISPTLSLTTPVEQFDYPGSQGLNLKVRVFYNVEMLDPIYDALSDAMLGQSDSYIQVSGELTMQNEGIEPALGNVPPPAIGSGNVITGTPTTGAGPNGELIWSVSGYTVKQNQELTVHLENHQSQGGAYDIYLGTTRICAAVNTGVQNNGDYNCLIDPNFPPGLYDLFSTKADQYPNRLATAPQQVRVELNTAPTIVIEDPATGEPRDFWANNSELKIQLVAHDSGQQPFNVYFNYGLPSQQTIATGQPANATISPWKVSVAGNPCPVGGMPCTITSRRASDNAFVASADLFISQPEIVIAGGGAQFAQGEVIFILLKGHTPDQQYDLQITDSGGNSYYLGRTQPTNALGDTVSPIVWAVFEPGVPGWPAGWPNGTSTITSHPVADPPSMTSANRVGEKQINIDTPFGPFITVDGGYTWPINSIITIRIHKHPPTGQPPDYYLKFGSFAVPVNGASAPNYPFDVGASQSAAQNYQIPPAAATGPTTNQTIRSFRRFDDQLMAQRDVTVTSMPIITVLEGNRVLPDATITISLTHHVPNSAYQIVYAGVPLLEASGLPFTIQTDSSGKGQRTYTLLTLSASSPAANPANYGIAFPLNSQQTIAPNALVATTTLTIDSADLKVTQVQLPASAAINTNIPMTVTIQNTKPVTIARYFDIDLYADPSPLVPAYKPNQFNFPGDVKLWKAPIVAPYGQPGDTFSLTQPFSVTTYGTHTFYGYADTSNFIFNENNEVNNVLSNTITIGCNYPFITDGFSNLSAWAPAVRYNPSDTQNQSSSYPGIFSGRLRMSNDGEGTSGVNDNASNRGHVLLYRTQPVATEPGLDVRVQVSDAPDTANFAKAGLQVRANPADGQSAKIEFNLAWDNSNSRHRIQMNYRTTGLATGGQDTNGFLNVTSGNPVWLRIKREPNSNTFTFYYAQQAAAPTDPQWTVYATQTVAISPTVYVGLFNASYVDGTNAQADFDNFSVSDTSVCPLGQGAIPPPVPPGLTLCTDPLQNKSFETVSAWVLGGGEGVVTGAGGHTGSRQLLAHSFDSFYRKPYFYQQFQMPASLLATTTLKLNFFYKLNNLGDGDDANDKYYAVVATGPSLAATQISNPVEIANGDVPPDSSAAPPNTITGWIEKNLTLPLANGINLADYAGQDLYLYIYNNSNTIGVGCDPPGCHASEFYFDDVNLGICTGEPEPTSATTKLTGDVVLHQLGSPPQNIAGVPVWAYAENGALYQTFTIQNGKFNFYDLPATPTGIKYFIYAEYHIIDPNDPSQIDTLAANTTVILKTTHTAQNPLVTRLDLFPTN